MGSHATLCLAYLTECDLLQVPRGAAALGAAWCGGSSSWFLLQAEHCSTVWTDCTWLIIIGQRTLGCQVASVVSDSAPTRLLSRVPLDRG